MTRFVLPMLALVSMLAACQTVPQIGPVAVGGLEAAAGGPVALDVSNRTGSVTIVADAKLDHPTVIATTVGDDGRTQPAPWAAAEVVRGDPYPVMRVMVANDGQARATDLTIHVPALAGLRVRNSGGRVQVSGAAGAVDVQNGSGVVQGGDVSIRFAGVLDAPFMARTSTGSLTVTVPPDSRGSIHATAGGNVVTVRVPSESLAKAFGEGSDWTGILNGGTHDVRLIAERGPVMLRVMR